MKTSSDIQSEAQHFLEEVYGVAKALHKEKWGLTELDIALAKDTETNKVVGTLYEPGSSVEWKLGFENINIEDHEVEATISQAEADTWQEWDEIFTESLFEAVEDGIITKKEYDTARECEYGTNGHGAILDPFEAADQSINDILSDREEEAIL